MSSETFWRDLKVGKDVEKHALQIINKNYMDATMIEGYCKDWDIWIPSAGFGVEVKSDQKSQFTGNLVIEIKFNDKPSALSTTKAKYWIFFTGKKWISVRTDKLKELVAKHPFRLRTFIAKGDTKSKDAYLMPQEKIESIGQVQDYNEPFIFNF